MFYNIGSRYALGYTPNLTHKHYTRLEKLAKNKYSSLLLPFTIFNLDKALLIRSRAEAYPGELALMGLNVRLR
jgi:hypothetical protein